MNLCDVAFNVVHDSPGGCTSLAPRVGKNATSLAHELRGTGTAKLGLVDAEKITLLLGDLRILQAFAANCGQMLVPLPDALALGAGDDCMLRLGDSVREFGEVLTEVAADLVDGDINDNELHRIDKECGELIASVHALREALAQRNREGRRP